MFDTPSEEYAGQAALPAPELIAIDLNFLPERYRGRRLRFASLRPWLVLVGFALLLVPSADLFQRHSAELASTELRLEAVSAALDGYEPLADERAALEARIATAQEQMGQIQTAYQEIDIQLQTWSDLIPRMMAAAPAGLEITAVAQDSELITIEGTALNHDLPSDYADKLATFDEFESVTVELVVRLDPETIDQDAAAADQPASAEASTAADESTQPPEAEATDQAPTLYSFEISVLLPYAGPEDAPDGLSE